MDFLLEESPVASAILPLQKAITVDEAAVWQARIRTKLVSSIYAMPKEEEEHSPEKSKLVGPCSVKWRSNSFYSSS